MEDSIRKAAIVPIGNEILAGRTMDTNSHWIAQKLSDAGILLQDISVIPDETSRIIEKINQLRQIYDVVITTGGIGPTHDDITAQSIADAFQTPLIEHPQALEILTQFYGTDHLNSGRLKMAQIPQGASLIPNPISAAPGFYIDNVYVLAGVPDIMKSMMGYVLSLLGHAQPYISKIIKCPLPESHISSELAKIQDDFKDLDIGSYPSHKNGAFAVNIIVRGQSEICLNKAQKTIESMIARLQSEN